MLSNVTTDLELSLKKSLRGPSVRRRRRSRLRPALAILDEFSFLCFSDILELWPVNPREVETALRNIDPDFLLVESAWNGNRGAWRYMLTSSTGPKLPLKNLLMLCRKLDIPTVFWNKEDPPHFEEFRATAKLFDYVYTTEGSLVESYRAYVEHQNVGVLQFAASPEIHNPRRVNNYREGEVAFGGQYFRHKFPERKAQIDALFNVAKEFDFSIFSRALGGPLEYQFPAEYDQYIKGSLPYKEMVNEYKRHKIFININSVTNSDTMCARRVFELAASKTNVISLRNQAIERVFGRNAVTLAEMDTHLIRQSFQRILNNPTYGLQRAQNSWRIVASAHLYQHRVNQIVSDIHLLTTGPTKPSVGLVVMQGSLDSRSLTYSLVQEQLDAVEPYADVHVYIMGGSGQADASPTNDTSSIRFEQDFDSLKFRIETNQAQHDYWGILRTDCHYGPYYLWDLLHASMHFAPEPIVSKVGIAPGSAETETNANYVYSGGWLAEASAPGIMDLLYREYTEQRTIFSYRDSGVYLSDGFSYSTQANAPWGV